MALVYLCNQCCEKLEIKSSRDGENKCGRKACYGCGETDDWQMHVSDDNQLEPILANYYLQQAQ